VRELRGEPCLLEKHPREHRIAGEARELDDKQLAKAAAALRARQIHIGHPALSQQRHEAITSERWLETCVHSNRRRLYARGAGHYSFQC